MPVRAVVVLTGAAVTVTTSALLAERIDAHDQKFRTLFGVMSNVCDTMGIGDENASARERLRVVQDDEAGARLGPRLVAGLPFHPVLSRPLNAPGDPRLFRV